VGTHTAIRAPPLVQLLTRADIDALVDDIYSAFNTACRATMKMVGAAPGFNSRWWNDECRSAAKAMRDGFWSDAEQRAANRHLKNVVRKAKRDWADEYITTANVWEVAAWRHGRRSSHIPALRNGNGVLVYDHEGMASLLSTRFFVEEGAPIPTTFHDDPAPRESREFLPFGESELYDLLRTTANKSAPGSSGIGWSLLKKGWGAVKDHLILTYNACLTLGHHCYVLTGLSYLITLLDSLSLGLSFFHRISHPIHYVCLVLPCDLLIRSCDLLSCSTMFYHYYSYH
jgi:hypothetical protein